MQHQELKDSVARLLRLNYSAVDAIAFLRDQARENVTRESMVKALDELIAECNKDDPSDVESDKMFWALVDLYECVEGMGVNSRFWIFEN